MRLRAQYLLLLTLCGMAQLPSLAQEYPFIHYTPKDGLINSRIRTVYQDSKGRLFFLTANGISIYDGARFSNYSVEDGIGNPVVNDMLEVSPDSLLLASNTYMINAWVRGRIKKVAINGFCPVVNKFLRTRDGSVFVATDEGVYLMNGNRFEKMDLEKVPESDRSISFEDIQELGDYLLLKVNADMTRGEYGLYLLEKKTKKLIPFIKKEFGSVVQVPRFNVLMCTSNQVFTYDLQSARAGIVKPVPLPSIYQPLKKVIAYKLFIDQNETIWSVYLNTVLKIPYNAPPTTYDKTTGLDLNNLTGVFVDKENVLWVKSDGSGLIKLSNSNVEIVTGLISKSATGVSALYASNTSDTAWLFNSEESAIYGMTNKEVAHFTMDRKLNATAIVREGDHFFLFHYSMVYVASPDPKNKNKLVSKLNFDFGDRADNTTRALIDNGYLFTPGLSLSVIKNNQRVYSFKSPYYTDQIVIDKKRRLWLAPRSGGLMYFTIHPEHPSQFLVLEHRFESETSYISGRSIAVDTSDLLWVGTRYQGLFCFETTDSSLVLKHHFTVQDGITDNFISYVACDRNNTIWVGTQSGLDKISLHDGQYQVEGTTRNNNIFQLIQTVAVSKSGQVWTLGNAGSILRISNNQLQSDYRPQLQISRIKSTDTVVDMPGNNLTLPYLENNITFEVAAPSFVDEKQVVFSYILEGSANAVWSKPSREATFNFINLPHGKYKLKIKAYFPVPSYGTQELTYAFIITPPWWDTWWSKILFAVSIIGILVIVIRIYYQRKLQKQKVIFEKQQAVEQERTRIAMEMHDDLGSGLTTIRYLAGGLSMQTGNSSKEKAEKIVSSAKSLVDNMNDIIWSMKSDNNTLDETLAYIRKQAAEQLETAGIDYHFDFPKEPPDIKLSNELKRNLLLISKEAIHNVVKHSAATSVILNAQCEGGVIELKIVDNGKGIDFSDISTFGNGMKSMRKRAEEIKALLEVMNAKGTTIVIKARV